jgi:hypothetical protein
MSLIVIDLNDCGVEVYRGDQLIVQSPGYAMLDSDAMIVGSEAYQRARLNPRHANDRFWDRLSLEPLARPSAHARHHADVAYAHLCHVWEQVRSQAEEVIFAVPGTFDRQQLGLLLGMTSECAVNVTGVVDAAVAASSGSLPVQETLLHLDAQLHRVVLTYLERGNRIQRLRVTELPNVGVAGMRERWANVIADAFVQMTRFDPMHRAETEQQLHNRLPTWLGASLTGGSARLELETAGKTYSIALEHEQLVRAVEAFYQQIFQFVRRSLPSGRPTALLLSHRLASLPGFTSLMAQLDHCEVIPLALGAAARGAMTQHSQICTAGESVRFVTSLPVEQPAADVGAEQTPQTGTADSPTHVLYQARAFAIEQTPFTVGTDIAADTPGLRLASQSTEVLPRHCSIYADDEGVWLDNHSPQGTFLNGERVSGRSLLRTGDIIRIGTPGEELQMIRLVQRDGTQNR